MPFPECTRSLESKSVVKMLQPRGLASDAKLAGVDKYMQKMIDPIHHRELADCNKNAETRTTLENSKITNS